MLRTHIRQCPWILAQAVAPLTVLLAAAPLRAAVKDNNSLALNTAASWVNGILPDSGTIATFDSTITTSRAPQLGASAAWLGIVVNSFPGIFTINNNPAGTLTLGSSGIDASQFTHSFLFNTPVQLAAAQTWTTNFLTSLTANNGVAMNSATLTLAGAGITTLRSVSGTGGLTIAGASSLIVFLGGGAYSGDTVVTSGNLAPDSSGGFSINSNLSMQGGVVDLRGSSVSIRSLSGSSGTVTNTAAANTLFIGSTNFSSSGVLIAGSLGLTIGRQQLTHTANTYTGATYIGLGSGSVLQVKALANGGQPSSIGQSSNAPANLTLDGGTLEYLGDLPASTDRLFTINPGGGTISATTAPIAFTNTGGLFDGATLTLAGAAAGLSTFAPRLANTSTRLVVTGNWKISNTSNSYAATVILGTLTVDNLPNAGVGDPLGKGSNLASNLVLNGGTLRYTGAGDSTDRLFSGSTARIDSSGTGGVSFTNTGAIAVAGLTLGGTFSGNNTFAPLLQGTATLAKTGGGTWTLLNVNTYSGDTAVNSGVLYIGGAGGIAGSMNVSVGGGATLSAPGGAALAPAVHLAIDGTLILRANGTASGTLKPASLVIGGTAGAWAGKVEIGDNALILQTPGDKSPALSTLAAQILSGALGGGGIASSAAGLDPAHVAVGLFDNALLGKTSFRGTGNVDAASIIIAAALIGDANLDGAVNGPDLALIAAHWNSHAATNWAMGDLNADGIVDSLDTALIVNHWTDPAFVPQVDFTAGFTYTLAAVPEPATAALFTLPLAVLVLKKRPRRALRHG